MFITTRKFKRSQQFKRKLPRLAWPLNSQSAVSWPAETRPETKQNKATSDFNSLKRSNLFTRRYERCDRGIT